MGWVALVTGGSRGIGEMIAEGYVTHGVKTYISARKGEACDATAARLSKIGECISIPADLSTAEGIAVLVDEIKAHEDKLDILVNNAGATWGAPIEEFPESGWDKIMDINVKSPFFLTPGLFPSKMTAATIDAMGEQIRLGTPLKRHGQAEDMAGVAIYLASRAASFVTGVVIPVDGGITSAKTDL